MKTTIGPVICRIDSVRRVVININDTSDGVVRAANAAAASAASAAAAAQAAAMPLPQTPAAVPVPEDENARTERILETAMREARAEADAGLEQFEAVAEPAEPKPESQPELPTEKATGRFVLKWILTTCMVIGLLTLAVMLAVRLAKNNTADGQYTPETTAVEEADDEAAETASTYEIVSSNCSWEAANADAEQKGGHLVVINSHEEFDEISAFADGSGLTYLWIGLRVTDAGSLEWVRNDEYSYYYWASGEPSPVSYTGEPLNYVIMQAFNNTWNYRCSTNDPCTSYPSLYSNQMGYIIEYEN